MRDLGDIDAYPRRSLVHGVETARAPDDRASGTAKTKDS